MDRYQMRIAVPRQSRKPKGPDPTPPKPTAKLFMHGRSQAVRLPKEFRFAGSEVRVSRDGHKVILEPIEEEPFDVDALWAKLDEMGARDFLPDGIPDDPPLPPDDEISFD
jgi:antitoxin VapB